jgi:hypothetical protein
MSPKKSIRSIKFREDYSKNKNTTNEDLLNSNIIKPSVNLNSKESLTKSRE